MYRHPLLDINNINIPGQRICSHFLVQIPRADAEIVTNKLPLILFLFINILLLYFNVQYTNAYFLLIFTWKVKGNIFGYLYTNQTYILFFHMKLQNFEFKNYLNHYLKRSDHFLGTLKFLHTVSVSSSDSLVIGFRCMFYKWDQLLN